MKMLIYIEDNDDMKTIIDIEDDDDQQVEENRKIRSYGDGISWKRGRLLGEGGYGSVFLATLKHPNSRFPSSVVAVKSAELSISESLRHERKVLSSFVGCPNIIQCFGDEITCNVREGSQKVYNLLLEYGSRGNLAERIAKSKNRGLRENEVRRYTRSILKGLIKIHQAGYVHCDLKPENIILVPSDQRGQEFTAKICDFGLAKRAKEDRGKKRLERTWRGTPMFLSPEAVKERLQEPPADMWALGCMVLEMLTGRSAWDVEEWLPGAQEKIIGKLLKGGAVPKIPKELSSDAKSFVRCCLKRMVKNRVTAKTLLYHPFVKESDEIGIGIRNEERKVAAEPEPEPERVNTVEETKGMRRNCQRRKEFYLAKIAPLRKLHLV